MENKEEIYLDNSATTKVCGKSLENIIYTLKENYGNPSSLHTKGIQAERELSLSRKTVANLLGCNCNEIYFTSGGTECNNLAVFGASGARKRRGNKIITTSFEHSSVRESMQELEKRGFEVVYLNPDTSGNVDLDKLYTLIDSNTILVSIMLVNNETGVINDIQKIRRIINAKKSGAILHTDAVQAFGKIPINTTTLGADIISVSSHKIHGPKGVGAIYIRKGLNINPIMFGGLQEKRIRPGTEALPLISGFRGAIESIGYIKENSDTVLKLNTYLRQKLSEIPDVKINSPKNSLPYIINFSTCKVKSETMLHFLAGRNIFVSAGSACSKGKLSHVLQSMGLSTKEIDTAIRVSFSKFNTFYDIDVFTDNLKDGIKSLAN